MLIHQIQQLLI